MSSAPFHRRIALATCVVLSAVPLSSALAQQPPRGDQGRAEMMERGERGNRGDERSLSDAVRRVQRTTGGHILGAERVPFDGRGYQPGEVHGRSGPGPLHGRPRPVAFTAAHAAVGYVITTRR